MRLKLRDAVRDPVLWRLIGAVDAPFSGAFTVYDPTRPPKYYKDASGIVRLSGYVGNPSANSGIAFTLPPGFRPGVAETPFINANGAFSVVTVGTDGTFALGGGTIGGYWALANLSWLAEK